MPLKTLYKTEQELRSVPLPNHGGRYAVVPHGTVIDETRKQLAAAGFQIERELYKTSMDGQIAQGVYHLKNSKDNDMGLMFAWSNSYNKQMRFKCGIGAQVFVCMNGMLSGDMASYNRKHMGNSTLQDVFNSIQSQISNAGQYFNTLVSDKEMLKQITLTARDKGRILGELFANDEILTLTQVGIVKREIDKPSHVYDTNNDSAWTMYNYITYALKESHPGHYISDHQRVHDYFVNQYGTLVTPPQQPVDTTTPVEEQVEEVVEMDNEFGVNFM